MVRPQVHEACTRTLTLCAALAWLIGGAACYPETVGPDDDDDDTTAADDDDTTPSADDDDDTAPFGDQDHDGYTPEDGDCDDSDATLNLDDADGDGWDTCEGDCDDTDPLLNLDDVDGDGHDTCAGDCDDTNAAIFDGADDDCDEWDNDCDGEINEDSAANDAYEPNDTAAYDLGDMTDQSVAIESYIHTYGDEDRYRFAMADNWFDDFYIDAQLTVVPGTLDLILELVRVEDPDGNHLGQSLETSDGGGSGEPEAVYVGGDFWGDDTGVYELIVTAPTGFDCTASYTLNITTSG